MAETFPVERVLFTGHSSRTEYFFNFVWKIVVFFDSSRTEIAEKKV